MTKIALLIAAFWTMADMFVVTPLLETIAGVYPTAPGIVINLCYCLSQGTIIIGMILVPALVTRVTKKNMMIGGGGLVLIFGGFGGVVPGLPLMLFFRAVEGVGAGICITLIPILLNELIKDENERNTLIGVQAAVGCVAGALSAFFSGYIASHFSWQYSYFIYFFSIIIILLIIVSVPGTGKEKPAPKGESVRMNRASWGIFVLAIFFGLLSSAVFGYISYVVVDTGLGDVSTAGTSGSVVQVGSFVGGVAVAALFKKLKGYIEPFSWLLMLIGGSVFLISAFTIQSVIIAYIGCFIFGIANGILFPWISIKAATICAPNTESKTIAAANIGYYIGMFGAIFFYEAFLAITHTSSVSTIYLMIAGAAVYFVVGIIAAARKHGELVILPEQRSAESEK